MKLGKPKDVHKLTLQDFIQHPIWISLYEHYDKRDERLPVVDRANDVTREALKNGTVYILCKEHDRDLYAIGDYSDKTRNFSQIKLWIRNRWVDYFDVPKLRPLTLLA